MSLNKLVGVKPEQLDFDAIGEEQLEPGRMKAVGDYPGWVQTGLGYAQRVLKAVGIEVDFAGIEHPGVYLDRLIDLVQKSPSVSFAKYLALAALRYVHKFVHPEHMAAAFARAKTAIVALFVGVLSLAFAGSAPAADAPWDVESAIRSSPTVQKMQTDIAQLKADQALCPCIQNAKAGGGRAAAIEGNPSFDFGKKKAGTLVSCKVVRKADGSCACQCCFDDDGDGKADRCVEHPCDCSAMNASTATTYQTTPFLYNVGDSVYRPTGPDAARFYSMGGWGGQCVDQFGNPVACGTASAVSFGGPVYGSGGGCVDAYGNSVPCGSSAAVGRGGGGGGVVRGIGRALFGRR